MLNTSELLPLIACPDCRKPLKSFARCNYCELEFSDEGGTPKLFPRGSTTRSVRFDFCSERATRGERFSACFSNPVRRGIAPSTDNPYHLDLAHLDVLNRLPRGSTVLEIGCGGGQMREFLRSKGHRYVGSDISKTRVYANLQKFGGPDLLCDVHFLPFADQSFDLVYSAAVTEHLACPYLVAQEVARALKPGGYYLGNVSFLEPWHDNSFFHMSPLGVFELLTQANFDIEHIWPGEGYSGYRALLAMGNWATRSLIFVGQGLFAVYKLGHRLRRSRSLSDIEALAKIAGATDWIARRPH
jgi:SAM-dependent methyltransferase